MTWEQRALSMRPRARRIDPACTRHVHAGLSSMSQHDHATSDDAARDRCAARGSCRAEAGAGAGPAPRATRRAARPRVRTAR